MKIYTIALAAAGVIFVSGGKINARAISDSDSSPQSLSQTLPLTKSLADLGEEDRSKVIPLKLWLKLRQPEALARLADAVSDPHSASFRQWLSPEDFQSQFLPLATDVQKVKTYLSRRGLKVLSTTESSSFYIPISGRISDIEQIFHVRVRKYMDHGNMIYANDGDPLLDPEISPYISWIGGLSNRAIRPRFIRALNASAVQAEHVSHGNPTLPTAGSYAGCISGSETRSFKSADGKSSATFSGAKWGQNQTSRDCSFDPATVQKAYGMDPLFKKGMDGRGQTVVIVDAFGSPTIQNDAQKFNTSFQLPPTAHFNIYQPGGIAPVQGPWNSDQQDWAAETTLDVEYAHVMAPGAGIALVEAASDSDSDLLAGLSYTVEHHLGNVVSNSWGDLESQVDKATADQYDKILQAASVQGIGINFASGDSGDSVSAVGFADVSFPAPAYVTMVGGTSLAFNADGARRFEIGWGNSYVAITAGAESYAAGLNNSNAPLAQISGKGAFAYGSGGGTSRSVPKPRFQHRLVGTMRMQPDIAMLADPQTGVTIIETLFDANGNPSAEPSYVPYYGGTSLACPMFSGIWAVANQKAGKALGNAAPVLYELPSRAIRDIVPLELPTNVTGSITVAGTPTAVTSLEVSVPQTTAPFLNTLFFFAVAPYNWNVLTFGTDSTLKTARGWDNVTGLGAPNGKAFVDAAAR